MIEITWQYEPHSYFESDFTADVHSGSIALAGGVATFIAESDSADPKLLVEDASAELKALLELRAILTERAYSLSEPRFTRIDSDGRRHATLFVDSASHALVVDNIDLIIRDADGRIIGDSKAERIAQHTSYVTDMVQKYLASETLRAMVTSFTASLKDPANSLVHLYEVRDAAAKHFGDAAAARRALGMSNGDWRRLGELANDAPLAEGRHRGRSTAELRKATEEELGEARRLARNIIDAFGSIV